MSPSFKHSTVTTPLLVFFGLSFFALAVFHEVLAFNAFGAEFPLFWVYGHGITFKQVFDTYRVYDFGWYRPTATALMAWIGDHFIGWHNLVGWKMYHLLSLVLTACSLYWFVLVFAPTARMAALLAACYYLAHPAQATLPLQMLPFDALHILFSLLSAGFFWRALQSEGKPSWKRTALSFAFFVIALSCKEVVVALPLFLAVESAVVIFQRRTLPGTPRRIAREFVRLAPFGGVILLYWLYHVRALQATTMSAGAMYRMTVNWDVILNNLRMLPLMTIRIFYLAGFKIEWRSYLENTPSTLGGLAILLITAAGWFFLLRKRANLRTAGLLFLAWTVIFLMIPIYSGGQIWHVTAPACGYAALFGIAAMTLIDIAPAPVWRYSTAAACILGLLALGVISLKDELHKGIFTTSALLTRDLLAHPPVPPEKLGSNPTIFIEDRMNLGGWPYGCYGHLMRYIYQRTDIRELVVTPGKLTPADNQTLMKDPQAYYVVYDSNYRWSDATAEMRGDLRITPANPVVKGSDPVQFSAVSRDGNAEPVTWSMEPALGSVDATGWYTPPDDITSAGADSLTIAPDLVSARSSGVRFVAGSPATTEVRLKATSQGDGKRSGATRLMVRVVRPEAVEWSVDPPDGGSITPAGHFQAPAGAEPRTITVKATSVRDHARRAAAKVTIGVPWQTLDIGNVPEPGAFEGGDILRIRGSGDIFENTDSFRFVFQTLDGDGSIAARISTPGTPNYTKSGLMIRETLSREARHVYAGIISGKTSLMEARNQPGQTTSAAFGRSGSAWMRLERKGDTFSAFTSVDGNHWEVVSKPVDIRMARRAFVGFAVSSGNHGSTTATFANIRVLPAAVAISTMP